MHNPEVVPDPLRNPLVRRVDWRFLLRQPESPRTLDLTPRRYSAAVQFVFDTAERPTADTDLVVVGYPTPAALSQARRALRPGGEVVCLWWWPLPGGVGLARRSLERAGFTDARVYWPGPVPHRPPQFWLPLAAPTAAAHVLAERPPQSSFQATLRPTWRFAARTGGLAPLCAIAQTPGGSESSGDSADPVDALLPGDTSLMLLTGGKRSVNKVVGLPFVEGESAAHPSLAVKFARVPEADAGLAREAEVLRLLGHERPEVKGIPRVKAEFRRAGRTAVAETALFGSSLLTTMTHATFEAHAMRVTDWLIELAGDSSRPVESWWQRLVGDPLDEFEQRFSGAMTTGATARARELLQGLGDLPPACEHRDCSPWNVFLSEAGTVVLLDWESAEPHGLPGPDLIYFLANSASVLNEPAPAPETYAGLFDASTAHGRVARRCIEKYTSRLGITHETMRRMRLLCWIVHATTYYHRLRVVMGRPPDVEALRKVMAVQLVEEELRMAREVR